MFSCVGTIAIVIVLVLVVLLRKPIMWVILKLLGG
jgi:hypothetical protein